MNAEQTQKVRAEYRRNAESMAEMVADAMLVTYRDVTGKRPTDELRDKIIDAITFHS